MSTPQSKLSSGSPFLEDNSSDATSCARDRIFEAAKKLFYRLGIRGVSVDAIAAEADTTKVTFYRVFDSKEDLVVKVLEDKSQRFWKWWDDVIAPHDGNPRAQLDALFADVQKRIAGENADRGCLMCNAAVEVVEEDHPAREVIRAHRAEIAKRLRDFGARNEGAPTRRARRRAHVAAERRLLRAHRLRRTPSRSAPSTTRRKR